MVDVSETRFEELVADSIDSIPPDLGRLMDNVAVTIDGHAEGHRLLGLYEGIP